MSNIKKSNGNPSLWPSAWPDFFGTEKFFSDDFFRKENFPAVNVQEKETNYLVEVAAPGMKKDDFKIKVENGMLKISAEVKSEKEEKENNYTRKEFSYSSFERIFTLPENAGEENIQAAYADGILKITIGKKEAIPVKSQEIKVS